MAEVVVHPGFVRTATTTLQEAVFSTLPGVNYLGRPFGDPDLAASVYALCRIDGVRYEGAAVRETLNSRLVEGRISVLSYENLSSYKCKDKQLVAERLKHVFPEATILFTIRNQRDLVRSWYTFVRRPPRDFVTFDAWWTGLAADPTRNVLDDLNFDDIIACYERLFSVERVHVIPYEMLRDDPDTFARGVAAATGLGQAGIARAVRSSSLNAGASRRQLAWSKFLSEYVPRIAVRAGRQVAPGWMATRVNRWQAGGPRAQLTLSSDQERLIASLCADGNRALAKRRNLPLAEFGYPV